jgi:hypothetical protein
VETIGNHNIIMTFQVAERTKAPLPAEVFGYKQRPVGCKDFGASLYRDTALTIAQPKARASLVLEKICP